MCALRGKPAEDRKQRLKLLLSGPSGVGKTTAAIMMPKPYLIDTEQGSVHYGKLIEKSGGVIYESTSVTDIITEVRSLISEPHPYLTVVIDPITTVYDMALAEGEKKVGTEWGRHYGYAASLFKRLCNLLTTIDLNVVITAHEKDEYETVQNSKGISERVKTGVSFDGFKKLDYIFDLWLAIRRTEKNTADSPRIAHVKKTRLDAFPDQSEFPWTYDELAKRFGKDRIEKGVETVALASVDQVEKFKYLMGQIGEDGVKSLKLDKALATVEDVADFTAERIEKGIKLMEAHHAARKVVAV